MANKDVRIEPIIEKEKKFFLDGRKIVTMRILVASLALAIFVLWFMNLPNVWSGNKKMAEIDNDLQALKTDLNSFLSQSEEKANSIQAENEKLLKQQLLQDSNNLLQDLIEETKVIASSTSATSTPGNEPELISPETTELEPKPNCPAWINCMPSLDEIRNCQIPPGCEDFTQIAY
jgi:ElaB/YqjD/DUF883 family membrane-anchored ribosome-binding protein